MGASWRRTAVALAVGACVAAACGASAATPAAARPSAPGREARELIRIDVNRASGRLPAQFVGLSLESFDVNSQFLDPARTPIARFLSDLGPSRLRIGGTESGIFWRADPAVAVPSWAHLVVDDSAFVRLAALTAASGWRVDLGVGLSHYDPGNATLEVADASRRLGAALASVEIGNEPDLFVSHHVRAAGYGYAAYDAEIGAYAHVLAAAAPSVLLAGPDTARSPAVTTWLGQYATAEHNAVAFLTQHSYATTACRGSRTSVAELLSDKIRSRQRALVAALVASAGRFHLPARIDETNSTSCGGQAGVSDRFASALWAIDYFLDAAQRGVAGVNLHGFLEACLGYNPLCADRAGRLRAQPVFYAALFVHAIGSGRYLDAVVPDDPSLSAYAVRRPDGSVAVVAINRDGIHDKALTVHVAGTGTARLMLLTAPGLAAADHVMFGGAQVGGDGAFTPVSVAVPGTGAGYQVELPHGSAALLVIPK